MDSDQLLGKVLDGRFRVDEWIAEGGMATVYAAHQLSMGRRVALKVIRPELALEPSVVVRFRREVEAVAQLRSPHVITFYDFGRTQDELFYIAMEFLHGTSLRNAIRAEGKLGVGDTISIIRQACMALGEAHSAGITHRDLSPSNLWLSDVPSPLTHFVKVLDFGLAKLKEGSDAALAVTQKSKTVGTPAYISPEAVVTERPVDHRADLYTLGVIVYEMLTGQLPYVHENPTQMAIAHVQAEIPSALERSPHLPESIDSFFQIALAKLAEDRFQDANTFADALATVLGDRRRSG